MNFQQLRDWIHEHNGRLLWKVAEPGNPKLWAWQFGGKLIIVSEYYDNNGWEIYLPADEHNDAAATLQVVEGYLWPDRSIPAV